MVTRRIFFVILLALMFPTLLLAQSSSYVTVKNHQFYLDNQPYYFIGTNYWYGTLLGLEKDPKRGLTGYAENWIF
jgi:mannan endo-1,4-beta-mannosidase